MGGADALPGRWRRAHRQQLGGKPDPALGAGTLQLAAAIMSLIQSVKLNGHDPYVYLKDVLTRLPTQKNNAIGELLPHNRKLLTVDKV